MKHNDIVLGIALCLLAVVLFFIEADANYKHNNGKPPESEYVVYDRHEGNVNTYYCNRYIVNSERWILFDNTNNIIANFSAHDSVQVQPY